MAGSLRDQLIKSGLATADRARKVDRQARAEKHAQRQATAEPNTGDSPQARQKGKGAKGASADPSSPANVRARAQQLAAERAERDRALARVGNEKAAAKALRAEIKQIVTQNDQRTKPAEDDVPYNFLHGRKIKRIYVTREHQAQLSNGSLVIVNNDGRYHLVTNPVADKIRARDPKWIVTAHDNNPQAPAAADPDAEHYAKFAVPDDLDW